jgi:hypothetical protein
MSTRAEILVKQLLGEEVWSAGDWMDHAKKVRDAIRKEMAADPSLDLETAKERAWQKVQAERQAARPGLGEAYGLKPAPKGPFNKRQLAMGKKEEREHTTNPKVREIIAKHHLKPEGENPPPSKQDYYTKLRRHVEPKTRSKAMLMALAPSSSTPSGP